MHHIQSVLLGGSLTTKRGPGGREGGGGSLLLHRSLNSRQALLTCFPGNICSIIVCMASRTESVPNNPHKLVTEPSPMARIQNARDATLMLMQDSGATSVWAVPRKEHSHQLVTKVRGHNGLSEALWQGVHWGRGV